MNNLFKKEALFGACLYTILWLVIFLIVNLFGLVPIDWKAVSTAEIAVFFAFLSGYRTGNHY